MKWSQVPWGTVATVLVASYGAVLSTIVAAIQFRKDRPRIRVKLATGIMGMTDGSAPLVILVEVQNIGLRAVEVRSIQFPLPKGQTLVFPYLDCTEKLPHHLEPGRSMTAWVLAANLANALLSHGYADDLELLAECRDGVDNRYVSNSIDVNPKGLLRLDA